MNDQQIPSLNYARQSNKNAFFQDPKLTAITFVSKDPNVKADYHIEDDPEKVKMLVSSDNFSPKVTVFKNVES
jgi:hypothetical protein